MASYSYHLGAVLLSMALFTEAVSAHKVVKMPFNQRRNVTGGLFKRDSFAISMDNFIPFGEYFVTASVGTPAQEVELVVDTGSSDIWMLGAGSCESGACEGGTFNIAKSTTAEYVPGGRGAFMIQYQTQGSGVRGDYFTDVFSVGGVQVTKNTMAVATRAQQVPSGIMGIGLSVNEAAVSQGLGQYRNFPELLVAQGKIATNAYSLYLDDLASSSGTMLFGGYDNAKFEGDLTLLPIQLDDQSHMLTSFTVSWTSLGISTPKGDFAYQSNNFLHGAVLDTGTTLTYIPNDLYEPLASYFNTETVPGNQPTTLVPCDIGSTNPGKLVFGLGGSDGVEIAVDFTELAVPIYSTRDGQQLTLRNGQPACHFGLSNSGDGVSILFGQTFLRSAYVLYDIENMQLGVAQTIFDSMKSDIVEYKGEPSGSNVASDTSGPSVSYARAGSGSPTQIGGFPSDVSDIASATGFDQGMASAASAAIVSTRFTFASVAYPTNPLPTIYPTTLPPGPTGRVSDDSNPEDGKSSNSGGNEDNKNEAGPLSATSHGVGTTGALLLALLMAMAML